MDSVSTQLDELKQVVTSRIDAIADTLCDVSRRIHANPETAFGEHAAAEVLTGSATALGLSTVVGAYGLDTAFAVEFGAGPTTVALMSEYDALPELGHACGHNVIAAIGLGAALGLSMVGDRLPGVVRYLGTPAEEAGCGKELLARAGAFDGVDAAMMVHAASWDLKAVHSICLSQLDVTFHGVASHSGLTPEHGRNALDAAVLAHQAVGMLSKHLARGERVNGVITQGGETPSVIPAKASARYFLRAETAAALEALKTRVQGCVVGGAVAAGCTADVEWSQADYLNMRINTPLADAYESNAVTLGRSFTPYEAFPPAVTDAGNVSHRVPVLHSTIACAPGTVMIHEPDFVFWALSPEADRAVTDGAKALAMTALDFLCDSDLRARTKRAFTLSALAIADH